MKTAEQILKELTLEQKISQLVAHGSPLDFVKDRKFNKDFATERYPNGLFGVMAPTDLSPLEVGEWVGEMTEHFKSVCPVPPIVMCESLHGILGKEATVFPQSIGMGASFDGELMERVGEAIGKEARALGISMSLAPDLDLGREPRWGRIEETYGEDTHLACIMGEAYVKGVLGEDKKYALTVKHFAAHGSPRAGVNLSHVTVTEQELRDRYLPPFERAIKAGARAVMPAYSALNGLPCHTNSRLMNDILRRELGFDGVVISDFGALQMLSYFQCVVENEVDAAKLCVECGIDIEAPDPWAYGENLKKLVQRGEIPVEKIDEMVLRVLKLKEALGVFDMQKPRPEEIKRVINCSEHKALARECAEKSIVLLKNSGVLPIKSGKKVAVVGPNGDCVQLGDYALPKANAITPYEAIKERAERTGGSAVYTKGCEVYGSDKSGFGEALELARDSDVIVCAIGGRSMKSYGIGWGSDEAAALTCGEGCDMHDLTPGGVQLDLVREMIKTGKDVVVVMIDGRPETLFDVSKNAGAIVAAWYPGEEGSRGLASLLFGDVNFTAKLPVTFPRHTGQLPLCYDDVLADYGFYHCPGTQEKPGRDYVFGDMLPEFPFGFGLSYSELKYHSIEAGYENEELMVSVLLENVKGMVAEEKVLVYIRDEIATVPQPIKKLVAVEKISLAPGEKRLALVRVPKEKLSFTGIDMKKRFEGGWFTVMTEGLSTRIYIEE